MNMKNVIVVGEVREETKPLFEKTGDYRFSFYLHNREISAEDLQEAEIFIGTPTAHTVSRMPNLKWVQLFSAGANAVSGLPEHVILTNAYGAYGPAIAEYMTACTLSLGLYLPEYLLAQQEHAWDRIGDPLDAASMKVLSVGMGAIGTAYTRNMHMLGASCSGVRRTVHDKPDHIEHLYASKELADIIGDYDVVALSMPGTAETAGMFDEAMLRRMKKGSILINVGRGSAIDTDALVKVAREGHFRGVALDVTEPEPLPKNHPLWNIPHVYITPHISGRYISSANYDRVIAVVLENLKHAQNGEPFAHVVDRKLGY